MSNYGHLKFHEDFLNYKLCCHDNMVTCIGGSYSDVVAEVSNRDTLGGEEVESSELLNDQSKRKRVYPSAGVRSHLKNYWDLAFHETLSANACTV